jgi:hypothetical protein
MIDRELIEKVVAEVLTKLTSFDTQSLHKPNLLVVGDYSKLDPIYQQKVYSKWNIVNYHLLEDMKDHLPKRVLFLEANQDLFVKGALGMSDTSESELLARCLFENIPVTLIPLDHLHSVLVNNDQPKTEYILQLKSYKDRLVKFGVSVESIDSFLNEQIPFSKELPSGKRNLLTQRDVQAHTGKRLDIVQGTIVTPLARDAARERGITIHILVDSKGAKE